MDRRRGMVWFAVAFSALAGLTGTVSAQDATAPAAAVGFAVAQDSPDPVPAPAGDETLAGCTQACPPIYGQLELLYMQRLPQMHGQPIMVDANTNQQFLSTSDLEFKYEPGVRATVGTAINDCVPIEFTYLGLMSSTGASANYTRNGAQFPIFPNNYDGNVFVNPDHVGVTYSTWVNSIEVNLPRGCGCCENCAAAGCYRTVQWFAGFRYLNLGDKLDILAQRNEVGGLEEGSYGVRTSNNLFGGQIGAKIRRSTECFGWEATGKAGVFYNDARESQWVTDFPNYALRPYVSDSQGRAAFVGELNFSAIYHLSCSTDLRLGYNVLWIDGVALGPNQLDYRFATAPSGNQVNASGGMLMHGVNLGAETRW